MYVYVTVTYNVHVYNHVIPHKHKLECYKIIHAYVHINFTHIE